MSEEKAECFPNLSIEIGSYVVAIKDINNIKERSVGLVKTISGNKVTVFFVGANKTIEADKENLAFLDIKKTGKPYKKKICNVCHLLKDDVKEFDINQTDAKGRKTTRPSCRVCRIAIDGKHLTPSESKRLNAIKPNGIFTCPICGKRSIVGVTANLVKDHNHNTGKGREWVCDSCNTGLGRFKDNIKLLEKVITYLKKYS